MPGWNTLFELVNREFTESLEEGKEPAVIARLWEGLIAVGSDSNNPPKL